MELAPWGGNRPHLDLRPLTQRTGPGLVTAVDAVAKVVSG